MKKKHVLFFSAFLLLMFAQFSTLHAQKQIKWTTFDKLSSKKMTVVLLYTSWDGWARRMENVTLSDAQIIKYGNKNFNFVRFDIESKKAITYQGVTYRFDAKDGQRGRHELAKKLYNGKTPSPVTVILNENQELVQAIPGYITTEDFDTILHHFGEESYKKESWEEFIEEEKLNLEERKDKEIKYN